MRARSLDALQRKRAAQAARFFRTQPEPEPAERTPEEAAAARKRALAAWAPGARSHLYAHHRSASAGADGWPRSAARPGGSSRTS